MPFSGFARPRRNTPANQVYGMYISTPYRAFLFHRADIRALTLVPTLRGTMNCPRCHVDADVPSKATINTLLSLHKDVDATRNTWLNAEHFSFGKSLADCFA